MRFLSASVRAFSVAILCITLAATASASGAKTAANPIAVSPLAHARDASIEDYRAHLTALIPVVQQCAQYRDLLHCDPMKVGPDDRVPIDENGKATRRLVRFGWLRVLLSNALVIDTPPAKPAQKADTKKQSHDESSEDEEPTTGELLHDAVHRLNADLEEAGGKPAPEPPYPAERAAMQRVLARSEFSHIDRRSLRDTILEEIGRWLNDLLAGLARSRAHSPWLGRAILWGFLLLVCTGLVWGLIQLERRWRIRLVPDLLAPASGAASARDWQLWLEDARKAASAGLWREAIRFVYWAAISRLESRRLWPADRARTPREYLALVGAEDPRKSGLATLTRSFERTWYGGRPAAEADFRAAEEIAAALIGAGTGVKGGAA